MNGHSASQFEKFEDKKLVMTLFGLGEIGYDAYRLEVSLPCLSI